MSADTMLQEAIDAISGGQNARARDLLTRLLRTDPNNPQYWLWLSSIVETVNERTYCLESALRLEPTNPIAMRGLVLTGARPADPSSQPAPLVRRKWWSAQEEQGAPRNRLQMILQNPTLRLFAFLGAGVIVIALLLVGIFGFRRFLQGREYAFHVASSTPNLKATFTSTPTMLATPTSVVRSPTPTFIGPTPLWMFLEATYTPVPFYVNTPHPLSEAFRAGQRAYERGDYQQMLTFMLQAAQVEPNSADLQYNIGEAYRLNGDAKSALEAYQKANLLNPSFGPAYFGIARATRMIDPRADVVKDLEKALELDPNIPDAYLEWADYLIQQGDGDAALEKLKEVEALAPGSPWLYLYRARAELILDQTEGALQDAQKAHDLDFTLLPTYLALGQVHLALGHSLEAVQNLNTYVLYRKSDPAGWSLLGQAYASTGKDNPAALEAFNKALELDDQDSEAYYGRGVVNIALNQGQDAVNDLVKAVDAQPKSFAYNLALSQALLLADRAGEAYRQLQNSESLAEGDPQLAAVYYWSALTLEKLENLAGAAASWKALLALPTEGVSSSWLAAAQQHMTTLEPPTSTPSPTVTPRPSVTPTKTATRRPSATPTKTLTPRPTRTPTPKP